MKEDILEQIVDGYLLRQPSVFTKHNVKYRPNLDSIDKESKSKYSVHSDIDVLGVNLREKTVTAVSCKSWQSGFDVKKYLDLLSDPKKHETKASGRHVWKGFREITNEFWAKAFRDKIYEETNSKSFNYIIAVTKIKNPEYIEKFVNNKGFINMLSGAGEFDVKINFLTLDTMIKSINKSMEGTAVESTEIGRLLQLISAADLEINKAGA